MAQLDIWNQALTLARARGRLSSLSELSPEQEVLAQVWPFVLKTVQSAVWWPSCKTQARLAEVAEAEETWTNLLPEVGYEWAFALPAQMLRPWHLSDYSRFSLSYSTGLARMIISTSTEEPILTYGVLQENPALWSPLQEDATVHALAGLITGPLTGKNSLARQNLELANNALMTAQAAAANDGGAEIKAAPPWLRARGYGPNSMTTYLYPTGELFSYAN